MGQKVNPISNRLGIIRGWDSNWFGGKSFGDNLVEDQQIRITDARQELERRREALMHAYTACEYRTGTPGNEALALPRFYGRTGSSG